MKRLLSVTAIIILATSCTFNLKTNNQIEAAIKKNLTNGTVSITDGVEANLGGFNGSKKELLIDLGAGTNLSKRMLISVAYHCADTAYQIVKANHDKIPTIFQIRIKGGGLTSDPYSFKSVYLDEDKKVEKEINTFMNAVVQKRYADLSGYMEPGLDLQPIITLLKSADAAGGGVAKYEFVGLQQTIGIHNPDKKPMQVIQGWVSIAAAGSTAQYPMLFIVNPVNSQLSSVYINPKS